MIDDKKERQELLALLAKERSKKRPDKNRIEMLEERLDLLDIIVGTRNDDTGFKWILEVVSTSQILDGDVAEYTTILQARTREDAVKESVKLLKTEWKKVEVKRVRLYSTVLEKQFRLEDL